MSDTPKKVLIVEDDDLLTQLYQASLAKANFQVRLEKDGEAGWQSLREEIPNLIVLDIMLPKLDGIALLEKIRSDDRLKTIPVIMLSSLSSDADKSRAKAAGANAFWVKNEVNMLELATMLSQFLP